MNSNIIYGLILAFFPLISFGQDRHLSFELAGSGGLASINFEKSFYQKEALNMKYRIGFSFVPIDKNNGSTLILPIMIHGVFGQTSHKLDLGIGQTVSVTTKGQAFILMPLACGYRFEPDNKNYYLRVSYTPIISYLIDWQWQHWAGVTYGLKLKTKE